LAVVSGVIAFVQCQWNDLWSAGQRNWKSWCI